MVQTPPPGPASPSSRGLPPAGWLLLALLGAGYALALAHGRLGPASVPAFLGLLAAGLAVRQSRLAWRIAGHAGFIALAAGLALHRLPGFDNALMPLPPASDWHSLGSFHLNLDKPLIGFWLLLACPWVLTRHGAGRVVGTTLLVGPLTVIACVLFAHALGLIAWLPGWSPGGWLWAANNLLLVCVTEELLFRGYVQGGLARLLPGRPVGVVLVAAFVFGLVHAPAGPGWALAAGLAGVGYGWAYHRGGILAAVMVHFLVNLVHFVGFT